VGRNEIEGQEDGITVGDLVAVPGLRMVGAIVGTFGVTGKKVGSRVGQEEGRNVGRVDGVEEGARVGSVEGEEDGSVVGRVDGDGEGANVGDTVGADGLTVGVVDGERVGLKEIVGL
jgi:hypothetical protein